MLFWPAGHSVFSTNIQSDNTKKKEKEMLQKEASEPM